MKVMVTWYKESGKYAYRQIVNVGDAKPWNKEEVMQAIVDNQTEVVDKWMEDSFYVVVSDLEENMKDPSYQFLYERLYAPGEFRGMKKNVLKG